MNRFGGGGKFGGGMGNIQQMMNQAKKMQESMQKAQEELAEKEVEGSSGGGMVTVTLSGMKKFLGIKINPQAVDPEDVEMLEDLITAAYNEAYDKAEEMYNEALGPYSSLL